MLYALNYHLTPNFCALHNLQCEKSAILTVRSGEKISPGYNLCAAGQKPLKLSFYTVHLLSLLSFLFFALCLYRQEKTKIQDTFFEKRGRIIYTENDRGEQPCLCFMPPLLTMRRI